MKNIAFIAILLATFIFNATKIYGDGWVSGQNDGDNFWTTGFYEQSHEYHAH